MFKMNDCYLDCIDILQVPISVINERESIEFVADCFENIRGRYICAANVHTTVMAYENNDYLCAQRDAILILPDGWPLSFIGRMRGHKTMHKTRGMAFMRAILADVRFGNYRHFFYGSTQDKLDKMISCICDEYPNVNICGCVPSPFRDLSDGDIEDLVLKINEAHADFVWIGIGAPRQELLMHRLNGKVNALMTGVGGVFNILAGDVKDAPVLMQKIGLEWFYRFCKEPKRLFKRYLRTNSKFIWLLLRGK